MNPLDKWEEVLQRALARVEVDLEAAEAEYRLLRSEQRQLRHALQLAREDAARQVVLFPDTE